MCQIWHVCLKRQLNNSPKWPDNHLVTKGHTWSQIQKSKNVTTITILFYPSDQELKVDSTKDLGGDRKIRNDNRLTYTQTNCYVPLNSSHIEKLYLSSPSEN